MCANHCWMALLNELIQLSIQIMKYRVMLTILQSNPVLIYVVKHLNVNRRLTESGKNSERQLANFQHFNFIT